MKTIQLQNIYRLTQMGRLKKLKICSSYDQSPINNLFDRLCD